VVVSTVFLLLLKPLAKKKLNVKVVPTNAQSLIGTRVKVLKLTDKPGIAVTRINDVEWRILFEGEMQVGDELIVDDISGTKLLCKSEFERSVFDQ
jgi:membrane protein implicated in regulation of membrane protease activity